jgi:hypothetical protein
MPLSRDSGFQKSQSNKILTLILLDNNIMVHSVVDAITQDFYEPILGVT